MSCNGGGVENFKHRWGEMIVQTDNFLADGEVEVVHAVPIFA